MDKFEANFDSQRNDSILVDTHDVIFTCLKQKSAQQLQPNNTVAICDVFFSFLNKLKLCHGHGIIVKDKVKLWIQY